MVSNATVDAAVRLVNKKHRREKQLNGRIGR